MNKTLTVNIGGMVFHIEEQAYDKLRRYLDAIRGYFTTSDGRDEILQDVESRVAEMFSERVKDSKQVIVEEDVEYIINVMGRPEQFAGEEAGEQTVAANISEKRSYRKLYRDPDDKIISGVCSGLGHRTGIDPAWLRIGFLLLLGVGGGGVLLYIVLAIVLPKAETTAQKLEMRGENVNIGNIRKAVEEPNERRDSIVSRFFETIGEGLRGVLKVIIYLIGGFFAIIGLIVLFALFMALLAVLGVAGISIPVFISDLFLSPTQQFWSMLAVFLVVGIPVIMLIYAGIKILFRIKQTNRIFKMSALTLWVFGIVLALIMTFNIGREFAADSRQRVNLPLLNPATDTLFVDVMRNAKYDDGDDKEDRIFYNGVFVGSNFSIRSGEDISRLTGSVNLDIQKADGDQFELIKITSAHGTTEKQAYENASKINYNFEQKDSLVQFSNYFPLTKDSKYRGQKVKLILKVPVGKSVYLGERSRYIIYDIDNVTNTYDGDMTGKTWTMTDRGLECKTCDFSDKNDYKQRYESGDAHINIGPNGVHISADGVNDSDLNGKDVNIHIDQNGVVIDSKEKDKDK